MYWTVQLAIVLTTTFKKELSISVFISKIILERISNVVSIMLLTFSMQPRKKEVEFLFIVSKVFLEVLLCAWHIWFSQIKQLLTMDWTSFVKEDKLLIQIWPLWLSSFGFTRDSMVIQSILFQLIQESFWWVLINQKIHLELPVDWRWKICTWITKRLKN